MRIPALILACWITLSALGGATSARADEAEPEPSPAVTAQASPLVPASAAAEAHAALVAERAAGNASKALALADKAIAAHEAAREPEDPRLADLLAEKTLLSFEVGKTSGIEEPAERMLRILMRYRAHDDSVDFHGPVLAVAAQFEKHEQPAEALKFLDAALLFSNRPVFTEVRAAQQRLRLVELDLAGAHLKTFFKACERHEGLCTPVELATAETTAGDIELARGKAAGAEKRFARALEHLSEAGPAAGPALRVLTEYGRGEAARLRGRLPEAQAHFESALKEAGGPSAAEAATPALRAYGLTGLARVALEQGDAAAAEKNAAEAAPLRAGHPADAAEAGALLGEAQLAVGKLDEAAKSLAAAQVALASLPGGADPEKSLTLRYELAVLARLKGEPERASLELGHLASEAAALGAKLPERSLLPFRIRLELGKSALDQDEPLEADWAFEKALARAPKGEPAEAEATSWLGIARMRRGDYPGALKVLDAAAKLKPGQARVELARAECLLRSGRTKEAKAAVDRALELTTPSDEAPYAAAQTLLGLFLLESGKPDRALEPLQSALALRRKLYGEKHPLVAQSLSALGRAQAATGDAEGGTRSLEQAVALREAASRLDTWQKGEDYLHLAELYEKGSKPDKALAAYRKSVEVFQRAYLPPYPPRIRQALEGSFRQETGIAD